MILLPGSATAVFVLLPMSFIVGLAPSALRAESEDVECGYMITVGLPDDTGYDNRNLTSKALCAFLTTSPSVDSWSQPLRPLPIYPNYSIPLRVVYYQTS